MGIRGLMTIAGVGQGIEAILRQRLAERELALREQQMRAQDEDRRMQREASSDQRAFQNALAMQAMEDRRFDNAMADYKAWAETAPTGATVPDQYRGLPPASGRLRTIPMAGERITSGEPAPDLQFVGEPLAKVGASGFKELGPMTQNGRRIMQVVSSDDPTRVLREYEAPAPQAGGSPYFTFPVAIDPATGQPAIYRGNARTGELTPAPSPSGTPLQPRMQGTELTKSNDAAAAIKVLDDVRAWYHSANGNQPQRDWVGPVAGRLRTLGTKLPEMGGLNQIPPGYPDFAAAVATNKNTTIKAITGAQMSEPEARRLMLQIPDLTDRPEMFEAKLAASDALQRYVFSRWARAEQLRASGVNTPERLRQALDQEFGPPPQTAAPVNVAPPGGIRF